MAELQWNEDKGCGFLRVESAGVYDLGYFQKYVDYASTPLGRALNHARVDLVAQYACPDIKVLDVGIGCGQFIVGRANTYGYDVNPVGVAWLQERGLYLDPYVSPFSIEVMTFWDSLEHIEAPDKLLVGCWRHAIVSIPIFRSKYHALASKHYRPDEHWWYFTHEGFVAWMRERGFALQAHNKMETELGREDIGTYVFRRVGYPIR